MLSAQVVSMVIRPLRLLTELSCRWNADILTHAVFTT